MQELAESFISVLNRYFESKVNFFVTMSVATATTASTTVAKIPLFYILVDGHLVFNWVFLFQSIGATYILMQMIFMLYKFYRWLREF